MKQLKASLKSEESRHQSSKEELAKHKSELEERRKHIRKMANIIALKGGITPIVSLMCLSAFCQPIIRNNVDTNSLGTAQNGWVLVESNNVPVWSNNGSVLTNSAPVLQVVTSNSGVLQSATFSNLVGTIGATLTISTSASLTNVSFPSSVYLSAITMNSGNGNLTTVTLGTPGTLRAVAGNVTISGQKLDQASVNNMLVLLAGLDGTGNTTAYSNRTIDISGGTSAAPSGAGATAKTTLQGRGCTVTTN